MRKGMILLLALVSAVGCLQMKSEPYEGGTFKLTVSTVLPSEYSELSGMPITVRADNIVSSTIYTGVTDLYGKATFTLENGLYAVTASGRHGEHIFNGTTSGLVKLLGGDASCTVPLFHSISGALVIKEIYVGGCSKAPQEGTWQSDKYLIIHNNSAETVYLDGYCLGTVSPYNATANNPWPEGIDFAPIIQAVIGFPGGGQDFPLAPGGDAIVALCGAIDHTRQYPLSVNLNREDVFALYNPEYFPTPTYHPAPGDKIQSARLMDIVIKTGQANAYSISISSPTVLLFRAKGMTMAEYVAKPESITQVPGSTERVVKIPLEWVVDAVEVFDGRSSGNRKRLPSDLDAGFVIQSDTYKQHSLMRHVDEAATQAQGFEVLKDTNNSTDDFYESDTQSLHN